MTKYWEQLAKFDILPMNPQNLGEDYNIVLLKYIACVSYGTPKFIERRLSNIHKHYAPTINITQNMVRAFREIHAS